MADKRSFVVYDAWTVLLDGMDEQSAGTIIKAICAKKLEHAYAIADPILASIFGMMEVELDAAAEKYARVCERRAAAGRLGGRPRKVEKTTEEEESKSFSEKASESNSFSGKANESKRKLNENENENENDNENENENDNENESPTETVSPSETTSPTGKNKNIARKARTRTRKPAEEQKHKRGEFGHVMLTDTEYTRLCDEKGKTETDDAIRVVDEYAETSGKRYKNYSLAIQRWGYRAAAEQAAKERRAQIRPAGGFSAADYFARVARGEEAL